MPEALSDAQGAQLIAMPFSAISLLQSLKAGKGDWIVQTAANGAVGRLMVALAEARGIQIVNLVRRDEAAEALRALGTNNVVSTAQPDWKAQVQSIIGDGSVVSAIDSVGGEISADLVDLLGQDGELVVFGTATGAPMPLSSGALIMKEITVKGFWGSKVSAEMDPELRKQLITELVTLAVQGALPLNSAGEFQIADVRDAVVAALTPGRDGKVMVKP